MPYKVAVEYSTKFCDPIVSADIEILVMADDVVNRPALKYNPTPVEAFFSLTASAEKDLLVDEV
jgi:hypothetical protein